MADHRRNRDRKPGRRKPFRDPKPVILVVCEGEKTEKQYLEGFALACHNPRVNVKVAPDHGVPKTLVQIARKYKKDAISAARIEKDDNLAYDSVWCVFDVDEHPNLPDALEMSRANGVNIAMSNPSFELWLLLHFRDHPGMQHRDKVKQLLSQFVPGYDKSIRYADYASGYEQAVTRGRRLSEKAKREGDIGRNPTTQVYELTESIRTDRNGPTVEKAR